MRDRLHPFALYLLAVLLGLAVCLQVYDWPFLAGTSAFWRAPHADQMQALTGWYGFRHDAWRLPLFDVKTLRYPQGANIVFTDSIPLMALLWKPFGHWLPEGFHYFGWWMGLCFALQAAGAVAVLRAWGVRDLLALGAGALMALSTQAWLIRQNHLALCGHFLVLFAIALYAHTQREERARWLPWAWWGLVAGATLIHLYLLAMVLALLAAATLQRAWNQRRHLRREAVPLLTIPAVALLAVLGIALVSGHFRGEAVEDAGGGFGIYSMNLLQPWYPQGALQLPVAPPKLNATGGQYEGYNYVGAGGLLLLPAVLVLAGRHLPGLLRKNAALALVLFALTMFALSSTVYFGETAVLRYQVPPMIAKPVEIFRSSGRFFWPVGYVVVLGGIVLLSRERERRSWMAVLLVAIPLLQFLDAAPARAFPREESRQAATPLLPLELWQPLIRSHSRVRTFPGFFCGPAENHRLSQELQLLSARAGVPVSTVFMARQVDDCIAERDLVDTLQPGEEELVVYLPPFLLEHTQGSFPDPTACRAFPLGIVCSRQLAAAQPAGLPRSSREPYFREIEPRAFAVRLVEIGKPIAIERGSPGAAMLYSGWFEPDADGAWMRGKRAQFRLRLPATTGSPLSGSSRLRFLAKAYLSQKHPRKTLTAYVNGQRAAEFSIDTWEPREREMVLPAGALTGSADVRVEFVIDPVSSPLADGVSKDPRELGILLQRVEIVDGPVAKP